MNELFKPLKGKIPDVKEIKKGKSTLKVSLFNIRVIKNIR